MIQLAKYSLGVGDRFAHQAEAQLQAVKKAALAGVEIVPVWNKSHCEHTTIGSRPEETRKESIARNVTENLYQRHIMPLFFGLESREE